MSQRPNEDAALCDFTAGVAFPKLWQFLKKCDVWGQRDMYSSAACGGRIRLMMPREMSPSWSLLQENSDPILLGNELAFQFRTYVFPFLEGCSKLEDALECDIGVPLDAMARAGALVFLGKRDHAFELLDSRIKHVEADHGERQVLRGRRTAVVPQETGKPSEIPLVA